MNPFLGVFFHWLGGLAAGSFYVPYKGVRHWAWEVYWLVGGVFSWVACPVLLASMLTVDLWGVLGRQTAGTWVWTYLFGALWGIGGLTFGLTMRYLGMSLGMGVALGYCAAFGTLVPPVLKELMPSIPASESISTISSTLPGRITLLGVAVCLAGIGVAAYAGLTKEREMPESEKRKAIAEFHFGKGILMATVSGILSACFSFALTAGNPIGIDSRAAGTSTLWTGLPKLVVVLLGGFTTNFLWCVALNLRNHTLYQYFAPIVRPEHHVENLTRDGREQRDLVGLPMDAEAHGIPRLRNYLWSALAGTTWYFQFFFYTMGETQMGRFGFASWTLHMASIIIFSTMWGWFFREWRGSSRRAHSLIAAGIALLLLSTMVIGYGTYLKSQSSGL